MLKQLVQVGRDPIARARKRRARAVQLGLLLVLLLGPPALADDVITQPPRAVPLVPEPVPDEVENRDGTVFPVSKFVLVYAQDHPDLPPLDGLLPIEVVLGELPTGLVNARIDVPVETIVLGGQAAEVRNFHASALGSIGRQLLPIFQEHKLVGVYVAPHADDIDVAAEQDLRLPHDTVLRLVVHIGRIRELRTVGSGDRITDEWHVDNRIHRRIRIQSPLQPPGTGIEDTTDLLKQDVLEDYLHRLNRHPGRRVEAALAPSSDGTGVALDYRVIEAKPWFAYFQSSNSGTEQTAKWQQRFGFVDRQLTNRDDIFSMEYLNAGLDRVHGVAAAYEAPWFQKRRPSWLRNSSPVPNALSWIPRDSIPWWGSDRLRWGINGYWSSFKAEGVGVTDEFESSYWGGGGRLIYNVFQYQALFIDVAAGFKVKNVEVDNPTIGASAQEFFMMPDLAIELERINEFSALNAVIGWEHNVGGTNDGTLELLGRPNVDGDYHLLRWDAGIAHYIEPLLFPERWRDPQSPMTSTLAHELSLGTRGQYAFDYRLVPQLEQVIGGLYSVRGYPNSIGTGDNVYMGTLEYRFHLPQALPIRQNPVNIPVLGDFRAVPQQVYGRADWDFIIRAFVDAGKTERNGSSAVSGPEPDQTMLGVGLGAELRLGRYIRARVDWGRALKSTSSSTTDVKKGNNEVYFLFSVLY